MLMDRDSELRTVVWGPETAIFIQFCFAPWTHWSVCYFIFSDCLMEQGCGAASFLLLAHPCNPCLSSSVLYCQTEIQARECVRGSTTSQVLKVISCRTLGLDQGMRQLCHVLTCAWELMTLRFPTRKSLLWLFLS